MVTIVLKLLSVIATSMLVVPAWYLGIWCARFALGRQRFGSIVLLYASFIAGACGGFVLLHIASSAFFAAGIPWAGMMVMASMSIVCVFVFGVVYGTKFLDPCCRHPHP